MTPAQLKRLARTDAVTARVISDGSRDYFVQINKGRSGGVLRTRGNKPMRFRSLSDVHRLLSSCHVQTVQLAHRVADEEVTGSIGDQCGFADVRLAQPTA